MPAFAAGALAAALTPAGASAASFDIVRVDHATQVWENGPKEAITVWWTGSPRFPVTVATADGVNCGACDPTESYTQATRANPIVWPAATFLVGNLGRETPTEHDRGTLYLIDAGGQRSGRIVITTAFVYHQVPITWEHIYPHPAPWVTIALRSLPEVPLTPFDVLRSALLAGALMALIAFPGQLFNSTLTAHYDEVVGWFTPVWRPLRRRARAPDAAERGAPRWVVALVLALGAILAALLDPRFGPNLYTLEAFGGGLVAVSVTTFLYTGANALALRRLQRRWGHWRVYLAGIMVALACVAVTRVTGAQPGYLYGVMLTYSLGRAVTLPRHHEGRLVGLGYGLMLVVSVAVWLAWTPVKAAAMASGSVPLAVLSAAMATIFLGGMTSLLFGLLPLRWLEGEKLLRWHRGLWGALFGIGMFLFVHVVLDTAAQGDNPGRSYQVAIGMFVAFGAASIAFWSYFRLRGEPVTRQAPSPSN